MQDLQVMQVIHVYKMSNSKRAKMATIKNFEELAIWKMAREITKLVYKDFSKCRDFGFRDQVTRAGISTMNNISEGFWRTGDAEFKQFLNFSKGSAGEIKNMYYIAEDLAYISSGMAEERRQKSQQLINSIASLIKYLKNNK
jgi:four helix bundle protein